MEPERPSVDESFHGSHGRSHEKSDLGTNGASHAATDVQSDSGAELASACGSNIAPDAAAHPCADDWPVDDPDSLSNHGSEH